MVLRGIPRHEIIAVIFFGVLSGYYIWNEPLKQYAKENFPVDNLTKVKVYVNIFKKLSHQMAKRRPLIPVSVKLFTGVIILTASIFSYRIFVHDYIKRKRCQDAEMYANYLYESYKEKEKENTKVEPI